MIFKFIFLLLLSTVYNPAPPKYTHEHLIADSPLWKRDKVHFHDRTMTSFPTIPTATSLRELREKESNFILDCIRMEKLRYKWSADIIPKYDAQEDEHAAHYFKSPLVQGILRRTIGGGEVSTYRRNHTIYRLSRSARFRPEHFYKLARRATRLIVMIILFYTGPYNVS